MPVPKRGAAKKAPGGKQAVPALAIPESSAETRPDLPPVPPDDTDSDNDLPDAPPAMPVPHASNAADHQQDQLALSSSNALSTSSVEHESGLPALRPEDDLTDSDNDLPDAPPASSAPQASSAKSASETNTSKVPPASSSEQKQEPLEMKFEKKAEIYLASQAPAGPTNALEVRHEDSSSTAVDARDDDLKVAEYIAKSRGLPPVLQPRETKQFLANIGYYAIDETRWEKSAAEQPQLSIIINDHIEFGDHTQYEFVCKIVPRPGSGSTEISWRTLRRLKHLRSGVHDPVRKALGSQYKQHFGSTPFALHTAPMGTTARLRAWFASLARCINTGGLKPSFVAMTFRLLDGPGTPLHSEGKYSFCLSSDFEQIPVTAAMFGSKFDVANQVNSTTRECQTPRANGATRSSSSSGSGAAGYAAGSTASTVADLLIDQKQYSHLPPLPEGWIRVRSRSTRTIYFYHTYTGEATFEEPAAVKGGLPPNWIEMTSRSTGKPFYWNTMTHASQFEPPRA